MAYIPLEKMLAKNESLYKLTLLAAERANQLMSGRKPIIEVTSKKITTNALQEIAEGVVSYQNTGKSK